MQEGMPARKADGPPLGHKNKKPPLKFKGGFSL
jgi:hypothetical protein